MQLVKLLIYTLRQIRSDLGAWLRLHQTYYIVLLVRTGAARQERRLTEPRIYRTVPPV